MLQLVIYINGYCDGMSWCECDIAY